MRVYRVLLPAAMGLAFYFVVPRAMSWAMSPEAPPVIRTPAAQIKPLPNDLNGLFRKGNDMSPAEAEAMRKRVANDPGDATARAMLLSQSIYTRDGAEKKDEHNRQAVWFAANLPGSPFLSYGSMNVDNVSNLPTYELMKRLFEEAVAKYPKDPEVFANYAELVLIPEKKLGLDLLERAAALDPKNPQRYQRIAFGHYLASRGIFGYRDKKEASLAVDFYAKAHALGGQFSPGIFMEAAFLADRLDVAERETRKALREHNDADAVHNAHTILGRIALKQGKIEKAKTHLLDSAKVSGSPVLGSFGPSMDLARELLAKGERDTVLTYLRATAKFWDDERQREWIKQVENGETPNWD